MRFSLANEFDTRAAGAALASTLLPLGDTCPIVVFIRGNLGAGKSTLVRGFLAQAGVTGVMPSPTYSLVEPYQVGKLKLFHMDAYRMTEGVELDYLGLDDIGEVGSVLLVEWPDHIREALPEPSITLDLEMAAPPISAASHVPSDRQGTSELPVVSSSSGQSDKIQEAGGQIHPAADPGRVLTVSPGNVLLHNYERFFSQGEWSQLTQVVT